VPEGSSPLVPWSPIGPGANFTAEDDGDGLRLRDDESRDGSVRPPDPLTAWLLHETHLHADEMPVES
jgi:hypothetical protein